MINTGSNAALNRGGGVPNVIGNVEDQSANESSAAFQPNLAPMQQNFAQNKLQPHERIGDNDAIMYTPIVPKKT